MENTILVSIVTELENPFAKGKLKIGDRVVLMRDTNKKDEIAIIAVDPITCETIGYLTAKSRHKLLECLGNCQLTEYLETVGLDAVIIKQLNTEKHVTFQAKVELNCEEDYIGQDYEDGCFDGNIGDFILSKEILVLEAMRDVLISTGRSKVIFSTPDGEYILKIEE